MDYYLSIFSLLILLSGFALVANKRIKSYIRTFRLQSLLIAVIAGILGIESLVSTGGVDLLVICAVIFILKVIYIPNVLDRTLDKVEYRVEKDFFLNIPLLILISCGLVVFSYFSLWTMDGINRQSISLIANSVALILIGLFFMITRKKAIGQIVGFLVVENGLFVTAKFATGGMPIVVDLGIFIDIITAVLIMGVMVSRIDESFATTDIDKLRRLRG
jgi:hydrogenase-4 component E